MEIEEIIKGKVHVSGPFECQIFDDANNHICDVRGRANRAFIPRESMSKLSNFITEAINEKLEREAQPTPMTMEEDLIRDVMMFAVKEITGRVLREAAVETMIDDFVTMFYNQKEGE